ncbi:MAG: sensor histidine kinase, partial [Planctomycetota bacterium]
MKVENHQVHLPIPVQENSQGTILLTVRSCDAFWCDRWLRFLESISSQIGLTILRLRIEAEKEKINSELIVARDQALESNRSKTLFLANMSHELRTPLNAILGYADLLAEDSRKLSPDEIGRDLSKIKKAGQHLLNLINDVLDMAKIESGKTTISAEDFDISALVKDILNT